MGKAGLLNCKKRDRVLWYKSKYPGWCISLWACLTISAGDDAFCWQNKDSPLLQRNGSFFTNSSRTPCQKPSDRHSSFKCFETNGSVRIMEESAARTRMQILTSRGSWWNRWNWCFPLEVSMTMECAESWIWWWARRQEAKMFASFKVSRTLSIEDSRRKEQVTRLSSQILCQKLGVFQVATCSCYRHVWHFVLLSPQRIESWLTMANHDSLVQSFDYQLSPVNLSWCCRNKRLCLFLKDYKLELVLYAKRRVGLDTFSLAPQMLHKLASSYRMQQDAASSPP
jgi:hypothetical protein